MNKFISFLYLLLVCSMIMEANDNAPTETFRYVDVVDFPHIGQIPAQAELESPYDRLPVALKDSIRTDLWNLGKNSAGVAVRFRTDSKKLKARWEVLNDFSMNHMTPVGIKGLDLYTLDNGRWYFVGSARPGLRKGPHESTFISNLDGTMRDYILYMPLYDSAQKVEIGILDDAVIDQPSNEFPPQSKPVVVYGTSLTQGGCANRPGMVYTSILSRWMNREFINLGFSGNGRLDYEIAELMGQSDAGLFILDHLPNCTIDKLDRLPRFVEILRVNHPNTPILLLGNARYTYDRFNTVSRGETIAKNNRLVEIYEQLKQNDPNIYYLPSDELVGEDEEATVDGTHFSDLGFMRMSENLLPVLQRILGE